MSAPVKYNFTSIASLIATLERMAYVSAANAAACTEDPHLRSFYNGKIAAFGDLVNMLAVSQVDGIPRE